jgi:uncharacterized protein (TIGR02145 family)
MKTNLFRNIKLPLLGRGLGGGLLLLCVPVLLFAQGNGVKVSNLTVSAGSPTTVTFDVSWKNTGMPALWSDTVWVFVDYNNAGKMERLPVTGATLTATSAPGMGKVVEDAGNNQGMWVVGNARSTGNFSATVQLLTATTNVAGACAYASNYPPVGKYSSDAPLLSFTGTPPYELLLAKLGSPGETEQVESGHKFLLPCDYTLTSFTDATGAPGIFTCVPCTAPGVTVDFTAFDPDPGAAIGTVWYLTDTRAGGNNNTYKVRKMPDGHIWMVQDLRFGDCPDNLTHWNNDNSEAATTQGLTVHTNYVGHCRSTTYTDAGFLYNWPAVMQNTQAYHLSSDGSFQCAGTSGNTCQGICPDGWHVPTGNTGGEFYTLHNAMESYDGFACSGGACWTGSSQWEGVLSGYCDINGKLKDQDYYGRYWSSTYANNNDAYSVRFNNDVVIRGTNANYKYYGFSVRCVRNY